MANRKVAPVVKEKPILLKVGKHYINPDDVSAIKEAKRGLYIVKLKSEPNAEWPIWVVGSDVEDLLAFFNIVEGQFE